MGEGLRASRRNFILAMANCYARAAQARIVIMMHSPTSVERHTPSRLIDFIGDSGAFGFILSARAARALTTFDLSLAPARLHWLHKPIDFARRSMECSS